MSTTKINNNFLFHKKSKPNNQSSMSLKKNQTKQISTTITSLTINLDTESYNNNKKNKNQSVNLNKDLSLTNIIPNSYDIYKKNPFQQVLNIKKSHFISNNNKNIPSLYDTYDTYYEDKGIGIGKGNLKNTKTKLIYKNEGSDCKYHICNLSHMSFSIIQNGMSSFIEDEEIEYIKQLYSEVNQLKASSFLNEYRNFPLINQVLSEKHVFSKSKPKSNQEKDEKDEKEDISLESFYKNIEKINKIKEKEEKKALHILTRIYSYIFEVKIKENHKKNTKYIDIFFNFLHTLHIKIINLYKSRMKTMKIEYLTLLSSYNKEVKENHIEPTIKIRQDELDDICFLDKSKVKPKSKSNNFNFLIPKLDFSFNNETKQNVNKIIIRSIGK